MNERAREEQHPDLTREEYFALHRLVMAITFIFGDGHYGHTGDHATRHPVILAVHPAKTDWYDEMSVDSNGVGCNHPSYTGARDEDCHDWMGAARGPGREIDAAKGTWRRDFDGAVAVFTRDATTIDLGPGWKRILGGDDPSFNTGARTRYLKLGAESGAILVRAKGYDRDSPDR